ncbi:MAG: RluA family pseudouridine synthase [Candidatus Moraniibacteriota bacterium]
MKKIAYNQEQKKRLDKFISEYFSKLETGQSRRFFQDEIKKGNIEVNNERKKPDYFLKEGDAITIKTTLKPREKPFLKPEKEKRFELIFEHPDFLIIDKPANTSVHPSENEVAKTLVNSLLFYYPEIKNVGDNMLRPGIVHRLDKETSGLLIIARNQDSFQYFKDLFKERKIEKVYQAIIWGQLKNKTGKIESFIGKSGKNPSKQATGHQKEKLINPKEALTKYKVLEEFKDSSLLEVDLKTGRKHQIRIHLHSIGHPVVGDKKYFNKLVKKANEKYPRHLLHAYKISFQYSNGKEYSFQSNKTIKTALDSA